jgi:hypothetical protein
VITSVTLAALSSKKKVSVMEKVPAAESIPEKTPESK